VTVNGIFILAYAKENTTTVAKKGGETKPLDTNPRTQARILGKLTFG